MSNTILQINYHFTSMADLAKLATPDTAEGIAAAHPTILNLNTKMFAPDEALSSSIEVRFALSSAAKGG